MAEEMPGAEFRPLLDAFNDQRIVATRIFSSELLAELLELTGEWTAAYYEAVDPERWASRSASSAARANRRRFWHAMRREFVERLDPPLADAPRPQSRVVGALAVSVSRHRSGGCRLRRREAGGRRSVGAERPRAG
jgi:hypothetical protein